MDEVQNITLKQKKIALSNGDNSMVIAELLKDVRTPIHSIVADDEFKTLVNALTLELETGMIQRVVAYMEEIRKGKLHEKE